MKGSSLILVVDDEPQIRRVLRTALAAEGYPMIEARTAEEGLAKVRDENPDLVILDINMPGMGGLEGCRDIRDVSDAPIIMLSVRGGERDKVRALDAGADDFVVKPFSAPELMARIRANLRRSASNENLPAVFSSPDLNIDFSSRVVTARGQKVHLTPKEFDVLRQLVSSEGKAMSHRALLQAVWGPDYGEETEYLRVCINHLRKKIEPDPSQPKYILTEPWVGYRFATG